MKEIQLTKGYVALVDDKDFDSLNCLKWSTLICKGKPYAHRAYQVLDGGEKVWRYSKMHRFILDAPKGTQIDHRDGNGINNQRSNLRFSTNSENAANSKKQYGLSEYKGVYWEKTKKRWRTQIQKDGVKFNLGCFKSEIEAALAYDQKAKELFGEFARLNFQP